jgi:hypothetical protein
MGIDNVTPVGVYRERREEILRHKKQVGQRALARRKQFHQQVRERRDAESVRWRMDEKARKLLTTY